MRNETESSSVGEEVRLSEEPTGDTAGASVGSEIGVGGLVAASECVSSDLPSYRLGTEKLTGIVLASGRDVGGCRIYLNGFVSAPWW